MPSRIAAIAVSCAVVAGGAHAAELRHSVIERPDGVHLVVVEAGDPSKPGILFIHGYAQSSLSFRRQFQSDLANRYHLVAFDNRGQGGSDKPAAPSAYMGSRVWADDIAAVMAATGLKRPVIVGWSFGGYVAMDYVRHYGVGAIAGINMVGSPGGLVAPPTESSARAAATDLSVSADLADNIQAAAVTGQSYASAATTPQERDTLLATELMMPAYVRRIMALRDYGHLDLAGKLDTPLLFSTGTRDPIVSQQSVDALRAAFPKARFSTYDGAAHLPFVDDTARFDRELDAFARETQAR